MSLLKGAVEPIYRVPETITAGELPPLHGGPAEVTMVTVKREMTEGQEAIMQMCRMRAAILALKAQLEKPMPGMGNGDIARRLDEIARS